MSSPRLSETSYVVLGLVEQLAPATPYDLKQFTLLSTGYFWSVPHTQIYTECARLAGAGLLDERREHSGRRRRVYTLTERGHELLDAWRAEPTSALYELRDAGTLKLFFGGDPARLAEAQLAAHSERLAAYELLRDAIQEAPRGQRLALELGIGQEREFIRFWSSLRDG